MILLAIYILLVCYMPIFEMYLPRTDFGAGIPDIGPIRLFSFLLVIFFLLDFASRSSNYRIFHTWIGILVSYIVLSFISISWSHFTYNTTILQELFDTRIVPLFLTILAMNLFSKEQRVKTLIRHITLGALMLSILSIYQMLTGHVDEHGEFRSEVAFMNANALAIFLVLTIPPLLYGVSQKVIPRILGLIAGSTLVIGILATVSRKGIGTMVLALVLYCLLKRKIYPLIAAGVVFAFVGVLFLEHSPEARRFEPKELQYQITARSGADYEAFQLFLKNPVGGWGYKGYEGLTRGGVLHNMYVDTLVSYGIIGFILFMSLLLYPLFVGLRIILQRRSLNNDDDTRNIAIIAMTSVLCFMVNGYFAGGIFINPPILCLLFTNIVLLFAAVERTNKLRKTDILKSSRLQ